MKKIFKKNQVIITALAIMIAVAGYINYSDNHLGIDKTLKKASTKTSQKDEEETQETDAIVEEIESLDYDITDETAMAEENQKAAEEEKETETPGEAVLTGASGFVAEAKVSREQVRSANKETLLEIINNENLGEEQKQEAVNSMVNMTNLAEQEEAAELLLDAQGFQNVVVNLTGDSADVIVPKEYMEDAKHLEKLLAYKDDEQVLKTLREIKMHSKQELADYLKRTQHVEIDTNSVFDIQIKRLHEYKRQQMNALYAIYKYKEIKKGNLPKRPITMIFGAKAAPAYTIAKDIIHLILCLQQLIENDPVVSKYMKIVMVENYNVTKAEKLIPACDISEQISLASKEASGTGNMKFMLNGAVTLGTEDGANVEIHELVGDENIYIFGKKSEEVIKLYEDASYCSREIYESDATVEELVDFIISKEMIQIGDPVNLGRLYKEIVSKDWFMALLDVREYIQKKEEMLADYEDQTAWAKKALVNIAKAGYFSADRTIAEYNRDIWKLS